MNFLYFLSFCLTFASLNVFGSPCRPYATSVSVGDFNVSVGQLCNDDDSANYFISTTATNGKEARVDKTDGAVLSDLNISSSDWNSCMATLIKDGKGLSDGQMGLIKITQQVLLDSSTTQDDAKSVLAQVCQK